MRRIPYFLYCFIAFSSPSLHAQQLPPPLCLLGPGTNTDFESTIPGIYNTSNSVSGWTISSQTLSGCNTPTVWASGSPEFTVFSTPLSGFPFIGNLSQSPFGGSNIIRLNNSTANANSTKIAQTFNITSSLTFFRLAFAGVWQDGGHACCSQAAFKVQLKDCSGAVLPCPLFNLGGGMGCPNFPGYNYQLSTSWTNWQVQYIDLGSYVGTCVTLEMICSDCTIGEHYGTVFIDAQCLTSLPGCPTVSPNALNSIVNFCPGSNNAQLIGPIGYLSYSWTAPAAYPLSPSQSTLSSISITNAVPGSVYTLNILNPPNCPGSITYSLQSAPLSIAAIGSGSTCFGGSSGTATVLPNIGPTNFTHTWMNSSNVTVGTTSMVTGLAAGIYSVFVASAGAAACGTAISTVTINTLPPNTVIQIYRIYCNNEAFICAGAGSNFQWYNNTTAIPPPLGTAQCYTLTNPMNGGFVHLKYLSSQGCQDSIKFTLGSFTPTPLSIVTSTYACQSIANGSAVISMTPVPTTPFGQNTYSIFSTGSLNPNYTATLGPVSLNSFSITNLPAGTYSVSSFDGSCKYTCSFVISPFQNNFTVSPTSVTLCPGNTIAAGISFTSPPSPTQYSYSWSPASFLAGSSQQSTIILPFTPPSGSVQTIIYTVVASPSIINCPNSKTLSITWANPATPSLLPIPPLCSNSGSILIVANPPGGLYQTGTINNSPISISGVLIPSLAAIGINTFTYSNSTSTCVASSSSSYQINGPIISISGNTTICSGQSTTLIASGASSYTWSNSSSSNPILVSPNINTIYSVSGSHSVDACTSTKTVMIIVNPLPIVQVSGNFNICKSQSTTLTASGANTYNWNFGSTNPIVIVSPSITSTYTVTGAINSCTANQVITVQVHTLNLIVSGDITICEGDLFTLNASGANTYTWNTGSNNPTIYGIIDWTHFYTVSGSSSLGCLDTKTIGVYVVPCVGLIENGVTSHQFKMYPNPSKGKVTLETTQIIHISIYNELDQLIIEETIDTGIYTIDLSAYASGIYFLRTTANSKPEVFRLIREE